MEEAKYFKDYQHNYLILKCEGTGVGESYQNAIQLPKQLPGLLIRQLFTSVEIFKRHAGADVIIKERFPVDIRKMTDILYRIYEMSGEPFFSIGDALSLFEEEEETTHIHIFIQHILNGNRPFVSKLVLDIPQQRAFFLLFFSD